MAIQLNKGRANNLLDLTPMIDMVFNLLIFFMVVTQFAKEERDLHRPGFLVEIVSPPGGDLSNDAAKFGHGWFLMYLSRSA